MGERREKKIHPHKKEKCIESKKQKKNVDRSVFRPVCLALCHRLIERIHINRRLCLSILKFSHWLRKLFTPPPTLNRTEANEKKGNADIFSSANPTDRECMQNLCCQHKYHKTYNHYRIIFVELAVLLLLLLLLLLLMLAAVLLSL